MRGTSTNMRLKLPITCFILEIILIILFCALVEYDKETDAKQWHNSSDHNYQNEFYYRYPSESLWPEVILSYHLSLGSMSNRLLNIWLVINRQVTGNN